MVLFLGMEERSLFESRNERDWKSLAVVIGALGPTPPRKWWRPQQYSDTYSYSDHAGTWRLPLHMNGSHAALPVTLPSASSPLVLAT